MTMKQRENRRSDFWKAVLHPMVERTFDVFDGPEGDSYALFRKWGQMIQSIRIYPDCPGLWRDASGGIMCVRWDSRFGFHGDGECVLMGQRIMNPQGIWYTGGGGQMSGWMQISPFMPLEAVSDPTDGYVPAPNHDGLWLGEDSSLWLVTGRGNRFDQYLLRLSTGMWVPTRRRPLPDKQRYAPARLEAVVLPWRFDESDENEYGTDAWGLAVEKARGDRRRTLANREQTGLARP